MAENLDPEVITRLNEAYRNHYESLRDTNLIADAQLKAEKAKLDINKGFTSAVSATTTVFQAGTKAVESFTRSLTSGESSFKQIAGMGAIAADIATDVAKQFGALGGLAGAAIQAASKLAQAMAAQAEAMVKTKDQVAKFGGAFDLSSDKLVKMAQGAEYYSLNMNKLYSAAGKAGGDLLVFSKNMSRGIETFAEMAAVGPKVLAEFNSLGIPKEELAEYMAEYVKYLGSTNIQLNASQKTQAALQKGSLEYTKNILELSTLTGKDVDTVKKKQQEAQASLDIQVHYNQLQKKANQLREAGGEENEKAAKAIEDKIKKEQAIITGFSTRFDAATTAAIRNVLATGGSVTSLSYMLNNAVGDVREFVRLTEDETLTAQQAAARAVEITAKGIEQRMGDLGTAMTYSGDALGKEFATSVENLQVITRGGAKETERQAEVSAMIAKIVEDTLKKQQNVLDAEVRRLQLEGDRIVLSVNPFATDMATVMKNAKKIMEDSWEYMKKNVLEPANKYINDVFGIDLKKVTGDLIFQFGELSKRVGGLDGIIKKIMEYLPASLVGAAGGAVAGGLAAGPAGAVAGAVLGAGAGAAVKKGYDAFQEKAFELEKRYLPNWMLESMGVNKSPSGGSQPTGSNFGSFDTGTGSGWDNETKSTVPNSGTSTKTRSVSPSSDLADELAQGQRNLGKSTSPSSAASKTSTGSLKGDTSGLDSELQKRLMAAAEVYGKPLTINSGFRSYEKQKEEYDKSVRAGTPGIGPGGMLVAKPGSSAHETGMAVDIQEYKDPKAVAALISQGLVQPYGKRDPVHFELAGLQNAAKSGSSSAPIQTASAKPVNYEMPKPGSSSASKPTAKSETSSSTRFLSSFGSSVSTSEETYARMLYDIKDSITSKMQEMIDKVAESNDLLGKIMRHST